MLKIGVLVSGGGTNLQAIIDSIKSNYIKNAEIAVVVSSNPNAYALERAKNHNIEGVTIRKKDFSDVSLYEQALIDCFKERNVELIVMAGFMVVIGEKFIDAFRNRIMNVHPSLIPAFCGDGFYGLRVHEAALKRGVKLTGATVHFVNEITDGGPIILQKAVELMEDDTREVLQKRVMQEAEWIIYPEAVKLFAEGRLSVVDDKVIIRR